MKEIIVHAIVVAIFGALLYASVVSVYTANTAKIFLFGYILLTPRLFEFLGAVWKWHNAAPQRKVA